MNHDHRLGWPPLALLLNDSPPTPKAEKVEGKRREEFVAFETGDWLPDGARWVGSYLVSAQEYAEYLQWQASKFNGAATPTRREVATSGPLAEAAPPSKPATQAGEWIEWKGGECPIPDDALHQVCFRDGVKSGIDDTPADWGWSHSGSSSDIVAYRLLTPAQEAGKVEPVCWLGRGVPNLYRPANNPNGAELRSALLGEPWRETPLSWERHEFNDTSSFEPIYPGDPRLAGWGLDSQESPVKGVT